MTGHKVIAINNFWATVIAGLLVTCVGGGITYALAASNDLAVLQRDMREIKEARLTTEVPVIKEQMRQIKESTGRMESQQEKMNDKLDKILQQRAH